MKRNKSKYFTDITEAQNMSLQPSLGVFLSFALDGWQNRNTSRYLFLSEGLFYFPERILMNSSVKKKDELIRLDSIYCIWLLHRHTLDDMRKFVSVKKRLVWSVSGLNTRSKMTGNSWEKKMNIETSWTLLFFLSWQEMKSFWTILQVKILPSFSLPHNPRA